MRTEGRRLEIELRHSMDKRLNTRQSGNYVKFTEFECDASEVPSRKGPNWWQLEGGRRRKEEGAGKVDSQPLKLSRENASAFELGGYRSTTLEHDICWQPVGNSRAGMHCLQLGHAARIPAVRQSCHSTPQPGPDLAATVCCFQHASWRSRDAGPVFVGVFMIRCTLGTYFTLRPGPAGLLRNRPAGFCLAFVSRS
jgi:hypothetical protein